jgi:rhodanese-related sulfurtransferase
MATRDVFELIEVSPEMMEKWLADGTAVLVDVREDFEHARERIEASAHHPLSEFDADQLHTIFSGKRVVFHCRTGGRSSEAAGKFGEEQAFHLSGGIEAWKDSGRDVYRYGSASRFDIMRQAQIVAGAIVLTGVLLGSFVNVGFFALSAFVGCGLIFAGLSGWCGMAYLLGRAPWNKVGSSSCHTCTQSDHPDLATDY